MAVSFPFQVLFLVSRLIADRAQHNDQSNYSPGMQEIGRRSPTTRVKTVPYSRVSSAPESAPSSRTMSMSSKNPPGSSGGFSATSTIYSITSSVEQAMRSASSKTHLLSSNRSNKSFRSQRSLRSQRSQRSARRAASLESVAHRERTSTDDSFDSWDTSNVDPQNRQLVLDTTSPVGGSRFLETIPASPTTSRSPSPGTPLDFEVPRAARRSRSFSPASTRSALPAPPKRAFTQQTSVSEGHIHPLFRSDSPTPPPMASPGTIVIAAPQAGQIISDRGSVRSLSRLRSGSLPAVSSPLTNNGSFESFSAVHHYENKTFSGTSDGSGRSDETTLGEVREETELPERKITPPVPEYILNAGSQTSLHVQPARKTPSRDGPSGPGLEALPIGAW
ncbi:hypothetical protein N0V82_008971 [Gnomoniopsis sp. IMI 355080]|nr:hypothetical protein N0V82_008971 [Gnomoniopsis sp. IMI 355080]